MTIAFPEGIARRPVASLVPYARNTRRHSKKQLEQIAVSIRQFGFNNPILVDADGGVIAGHGRLLAAQKIGLTEVPVVELTHLSPEERRAYIIADNKIHDESDFDEDLLAEELAQIKALAIDLHTLGFSDLELKKLVPDLSGGAGGQQRQLLTYLDVCIAEPRTVTQHGDHWLVLKRHHLLIASVTDEWHLWRHLLEGNRLFVPYPGPFVPFSERRDKHDFIMVQPDPYIAGHLLDRVIDIEGEDAVERVTA